MKEQFGFVGGVFVIILVAIAPVAAWLTHVVTCIATEAWGFLIAGAILVPVGVVHGVGIWFGVW